MFTGLMLNTWIAATIVAVLAGVLGFSLSFIFIPAPGCGARHPYTGRR